MVFSLISFFREKPLIGIVLLINFFGWAVILAELVLDKYQGIKYGYGMPATTLRIPPPKRKGTGKMTVYDPQIVVTEVLLVLERYKIPVSLLDRVLNDIHNAVMQQPVTAGMAIGLPLHEYEKYGKELLQQLENNRKKFPDEFSG